MSAVEQWIVSPEVQMGVDESGGATYQVCRKPGGRWERFSGEIKGFKPKPGHFARIEVEITPMLDPPADGSSLAHKLLRIIGEATSEDDL